MNADIARQARHRESFGRPCCPRCGAILLIAEQSAFNFNGGIRHDWACDDCGEEFATSVRALPSQA